MIRYFFGAVLLCLGFAAHAADVRLNWTAPTACEGGAPITDCAVTGYEIQRANTLTDAFAVLKGVGVTTSHTLTGVSPGQHCYRLRANSAQGFSVPSNAACVTIPNPVPGAPMNVTVTITVSIGP